MPTQEEAILSALLESSEDPIWSVDLEHRLIKWNLALQREIVTAFGVEPAPGKLLDELLPAERAAKCAEYYRRALLEGPFRVEDSLFSAKSLELAFHPIVSDGKAVGVSVLGRDINERKAAELTKQAAESRTREIFNGALEGLFQAEPRGPFVSANRSLARILGYASADELIGTVKDLEEELWADPEELGEFRRKIDEEGFVLGFECRLRHKDGSIVWASLSGRKNFLAERQKICYEGSIIDITNRMQAVAALAESEARFRRFFEESGCTILLVDPVGGEIVDANPAAAAYYGYAQDELIGMDIDKLNAMPSRETELLNEQLANRDRHYFQVQNRLASGELRDVEVYASRIEVKGRSVLCAVEHDVTDRKRAEIQLRESEERYRATFDQAAVGIVHATFEGVILRCNARFAEMIGYSEEEVPGRTVKEITAPEDVEESVDAMRRIAEDPRGAIRMEKRYLRKDGKPRWARVTSSTQFDSENRPIYMMAFTEDIQAQKEAEARLAEAIDALRASEERYRTAFQTSIDAININQVSDGKYIDVNQAFLDIMGFQREEVIGKTSLELKIWANLRDRRRMINRLRQGPGCRGLEAQFRKKNGEIFWGEMSASEIEIDGVPCLLSITRDITKTKAAEAEIRSLAFYDSLTGLPNRRLFHERLQRALALGVRNRREKALLFIDLDNFKTLNDTLGHPIGDLLLQETARRLSACVRETDSVARLGGDEFVVMIEELGATAEMAAAQAKVVAEKILRALSQPYQLNGRVCHSSCSIGVAIFGIHRQSTDEILQQADIAMYQAKEAGRNTVRFFAPALQAAVQARAAMEEDLRLALESKQFLLYYQPQLERGRLAGVEALLRWNHPRYGLLLPGSFISLAEDTGLIVPLGAWVLETAFNQIKAWENASPALDLTISVNISARQLRQPDFVETVLAAIERSGANPHQIRLEITESMLVESVDDVIAKMTALRSHGLRFSLDDFGTGYSSLTYLKKLPLDQLKIDWSFVRDIQADGNNGAIAHTIVALSSAMGLPVIAEGVETEEQRAYLEGMGCHSYQGYLLSRPLPPQEFESLLRGII